MSAGLVIDSSFAGLAVAAVGFGAVAVERIRGGLRRPDSHGASRWAKSSELRQLHADPATVCGAVIGWNGRKLLRLPDEDNLLVFGVQRSGKTSTVVVPSLLTWPGAVVATSTKEELVRLTGRHRASLGSTHVFAPMDADHRWVSALGLSAVAWNPLGDVTGSGIAAEVADRLHSRGQSLPLAPLVPLGCQPAHRAVSAGAPIR